MSGQAGASRRERYFQVDYASGIYENIAAPPCEGNPADYVARRFAEMSAPYETILSLALPRLRELFDEYRRGDESPLVEYDGAREWIYGAVLEDTGGKRAPGDEEHGARWFAAGERAAYVRTSAGIAPGGLDAVTITFAVNGQVRRSDLDRLAEGAAAIIRACLDAAHGRESAPAKE